MKCTNCNDGVFISKLGSLQRTDKYAGAYTVDDIEYSKCDSCGDLLFPIETARMIEQARDVARQNVIKSLPLSSFVSAKEAATYLDISKQALHKHRRIRRGFIFQTTFDGKTLYLRKSLELFKANGDGRFSIFSYKASNQYSDKAEMVIRVAKYCKSETQFPLYRKEHFIQQFDVTTQTGKTYA